MVLVAAGHVGGRQATAAARGSNPMGGLASLVRKLWFHMRRPISSALYSTAGAPRASRRCLSTVSQAAAAATTLSRDGAAAQRMRILGPLA